MRNRGANKRAMFVFKAQTLQEAEIGGEIEMQIESNWRKTGTITSAVNLDGVLWLQVVMNNDTTDKQKFRLLNGGPLEYVVLPYSLGE